MQKHCLPCRIDVKKAGKNYRYYKDNKVDGTLGDLLYWKISVPWQEVRVDDI